MKAKITKIILLLSAVLLNGCLSMNPDKAQRTISHWIPPGTPQEDAIRIMGQHGFEVSPTRMPAKNGEPALWCTRHTKIMGHSWCLYVHLENGKVISIDRPVTDTEFLMRHKPS